MKKRYDDISGKKYGRLLVISYAGFKTIGIRVKQTQSQWLCRCDCGVEKVITAHDLKRGSTVSCGCWREEKRATTQHYSDLKGKRFGRLLVVAHAGTETGATGKKRSVWLCKCYCGGSKVVSAHSLKNKITRSCGCMVTELRQAITLPPEMAIKSHIINHYKSRAKERGQRWKLSDDFASWLLEQNCHYCGEEPNLVRRRKKDLKEHKFIRNTIDRVDSAKGYEPGNVVPACLKCNNSKQARSYEEFTNLGKQR